MLHSMHLAFVDAPMSYMFQIVAAALCLSMHNFDQQGFWYQCTWAKTCTQGPAQLDTMLNAAGLYKLQQHC